MGRVFPIVTLLSLLCILTNAWSVRTNLPSKPLPFNFTYLFTAILNLDTEYKSEAIPVLGGIQLTTPILNGTLAGPAANGTIDSGIASPSAIYENTVQVPVIQAYGFMNDGTPFMVNELSIGPPQRQVTRINFSIGGGAKYAVLRNGFIMTTVTPSKDRTQVIVQVYNVESTAQQS